MHRFAPLALLLLLVTATIGTDAAEAPLLLRVERQTQDDLTDLRAAGYGVVLETLPCLFVRGDEADRLSLEGAGRTVAIVDDRAHKADFTLIGLRPDSDREAVATLGMIVLEEENWVLLRVPRGTRLDALRGSKVFASLVPVKAGRDPGPGQLGRQRGVEVAAIGDQRRDAVALVACRDLVPARRGAHGRLVRGDGARGGRGVGGDVDRTNREALLSSCQNG